jgi:serpin B
MAREAAEGNLAFSPASITMALGMTRAGAQGESARQLDALLAAPPDQVHAGLNALDQALAARSGTRKNEQDADAEITLTTANSLWAQEGATWEAPFLDTLKGRYGVGVHTVDYVSDAEGARRAVNGWVADETHDHITDLIGEGVFDEATRLTLVNALYLAAPWHKAFDEAKPITFHTASGADVSAPAMFSSRARVHRSSDGWQAVTIPYAGQELAMTVLVPDAGRLADVERGLDDERLASLLAEGEVVPVHLTLPRFDLASRPDLTAALKAVGVTEPFETEEDFDPMSRDPQVRPLRLAAALHQATVAVDEKGTVASAATAMVFEATGAPLDPVTLVVDRPFLFVIHDVATATPLFIGRVADPTKR